jgi:hypothetical protein
MGRYSYCLQGDTTQGIPHTMTIINLLCFPIWVLIIPDSPASALWSNQQKHLVVKQEKLGENVL